MSVVCLTVIFSTAGVVTVILTAGRHRSFLFKKTNYLTTTRELIFVLLQRTAIVTDNNQARKRTSQLKNISHATIMLLGANKRIPIAMRSLVTTALFLLLGVTVVIAVRAEKVFPVSSFQPVNTNANVVAVEEESSSSSTDGVLVTGRSREREKKARNERDELLLHNTLAAFAGSAYVHNSNNNQVAARVDKVGDKGDNSFDLETDSSSSTSLDLEEENTVGAASTIEIDAKDESSASSSLDLDETVSNASNSSTLVEDYADDDDEGDTTDDDDEEALLLQNLTTTTTSVPLDYTTSDVVLVSSSNRAIITGGIEENNSTEDCRTISKSFIMYTRLVFL